MSKLNEILSKIRRKSDDSVIENGGLKEKYRRISKAYPELGLHMEKEGKFGRQTQ